MREKLKFLAKNNIKVCVIEKRYVLFTIDTNMIIESFESQLDVLAYNV